ncbi:MAG TPA: diacylglycerol kinase family protein, partial [Acidimicrobiales bacterium]|nr:diacylglycerol kinase family protein [Acidimicrobiales bacterium]
DGAGVRIVVNPSAGPVWAKAATDDLRAQLPAADVVELAEADDLRALLCDPTYSVIGAAGGDGTLGTAAQVAAERDVPLVVVPGGTLNHLTRDLGIESADEAVAAVREGGVACVDLGVVGDRTFVNTLSFGGYSAVVDAREQLEGRLGKWPALVVALLRELPRMEPCRLELDGARVDVWLGWIGNGAYDPPGLAPAWREALDDGLLDVRLVHGGRLARSRFLLAAMLGRLGVSGVYSERLVPSLHLRSLSGPLRLVADGETFDGAEELLIEKRTRALQVVLPSRETAPGR